MNIKVSPPIWFFIVAVVAAAWNGLGIVAFVAERLQTPEQLAQLPALEKALYESKPNWAIAAFATGVFGGLLGCLLLLVKNKAATFVFVASLLGVLAHNYYLFGIAKAHEFIPSSGYIGTTLVLAVCIALIFLSRSATQKNWLV